MYEYMFRFQPEKMNICIKIYLELTYFYIKNSIFALSYWNTSFQLMLGHWSNKQEMKQLSFALHMDMRCLQMYQLNGKWYYYYQLLIILFHMLSSFHYLVEKNVTCTCLFNAREQYNNWQQPHCCNMLLLFRCNWKILLSVAPPTVLNMQIACLFSNQHLMH